VLGNHLGLSLGELTIAQQRAYVRCTFGSPEAWSDWDSNVAADHPLASLAEVFSFGATGYVRLLESIYNEVSAWLQARARLLRAQ